MYYFWFGLMATLIDLNVYFEYCMQPTDYNNRSITNNTNQIKMHSGRTEKKKKRKNHLRTMKSPKPKKLSDNKQGCFDRVLDLFPLLA